MHTLATRATARTQSPPTRTFEASTPTVARGANRPDRGTIGHPADRDYRMSTHGSSPLAEILRSGVDGRAERLQPT